LSAHTIDCRRLLCPLPVIRVQDKVATLAPGDRLEAVCTDPGALNDIPAWCRINGHRVLETRSDDGDHVVALEVGPSRPRNGG
jgi:tRNA 2-thiouridine synthesizing protein A